MKLKMTKQGNVYYPMVYRRFLLWGGWDYLYPDGWSSGQMMCFYTEEDAEDFITYNESIGNHIEREYTTNKKKGDKNKDKKK